MPTYGVFILFCIYHSWFSLDPLDLGFFHDFLRILSHFLITSNISSALFSFLFPLVCLPFKHMAWTYGIWLHLSIWLHFFLLSHNFWLLSSVFFFILFLFAIHFGDHQAHCSFPWLCQGQISLGPLFYSLLLTFDLPKYSSSESVCDILSVICSYYTGALLVWW